MIRWMGVMTNAGIEEIMISQVAVLREQMNSKTVSGEDSQK
jgi:hypothetical protein